MGSYHEEVQGSNPAGPLGRRGAGNKCGEGMGEARALRCPDRAKRTARWQQWNSKRVKKAGQKKAGCGSKLAAVAPGKTAGWRRRRRAETCPGRPQRKRRRPGSGGGQCSRCVRGCARMGRLDRFGETSACLRAPRACRPTQTRAREERP